MQISSKIEKQWTVVSVSGRVDGHTAPDFETACRDFVEKGTRFLAVDFSDVPYISSAGLRVLLSTLKLIGKSAGKMVLVNPKDNVREVLEISGFANLFTILESAEKLTPPEA